VFNHVYIHFTLGNFFSFERKKEEVLLPITLKLDASMIIFAEFSHKKLNFSTIGMRCLNFMYNIVHVHNLVIALQVRQNGVKLRPTIIVGRGNRLRVQTTQDVSELQGSV
jgi:hypothetical protein